MTKTVSVCGWEAYQHYKDRDPPWIKLYRDILSSEPWVLGTDKTRLVQVASTLLAARYKNEIPLNFTLLRKVAHLDMSEEEFGAAVSHLERCKFLEIKGSDPPSEHAASIALASCDTTSSAVYSEQSRAEQSRAEARGRARAAQPKQAEEPDPPGLSAAAAERFIAYRKTRKPAIKPESMAAFKRQLAKYGDRQMEVVEHSIANGYQGLIEPKDSGPSKANAGQPRRELPDAYEVARRARGG